MISANDVKALREKTQVGMMECKKALEEAKGDMEQAVEILRKKGMMLAKKKEGREAKEGILGAFSDEKEKSAGLIEVNCETDFVIKTDDFQDFVARAVRLVQTQKPKTLENLLELPLNGKETVSETLTHLITKIGENIQVKRFVCWEAKPQETVGLYLHAGSKIGVLVCILDPAKPVAVVAAKEIAMHVAAMNPRYLCPAEVPADILEKEKEILRAQVDAKKPKEIQEKIIEGKLNKFYSEECLENQVFVKDPEGKKTVGAWLKAVSPTAKIEKFVRWQVGG